MKKLLLFLLVLLASSVGAQTTIIGGGGGFSSGSAATGCTAYSLVYVDSSGNLACALAPINGSVSTAGRGIFSVLDTITGASATSNFLNITATFPATLSAETNAVNVSITGDNDISNQNAIKVTLDGSTGTNAKYSSIYGVLSGAGTSGNWSAGVKGEAFLNTNAKTILGGHFGASSVNAGNASSSNIALASYAGENGTAPLLNNGIQSGAKSGTATNAIGGYFFLNSTAYSTQGLFDPIAVTGTAALVADNKAVAANIFEARDNGTAVLTVADGGATTFTGNVNLGGSTNYLSSTGDAIFDMGGGGGVGGIAYRVTNTPDMMLLYTGTTPNSVHFAEYGDRTFDFNNGRCGTSACTNPALIIHSSDQATTEYGQLSVDTSGAFSHQSNFAEIKQGGTKTGITESSAQAIIRVGIPTSTNVYGMTVFYTVYDINGANYVTRTGSVKVQGGNSGGTATCTINTTQDAEGEDGSQIATSNAYTLTYTWTNVVSTTNCDLSLNAASSAGTNTYAITWSAVLNGNSSAITITGQ